MERSTPAKWRKRSWQGLPSGMRENSPTCGRNAPKRRRGEQAKLAIGTRASLRRKSTIRGLIAEGALSKAAKHLVSEGLANVLEGAVANQLRDLHPAGSGPLPADLPSSNGRARTLVDPGADHDREL